MGWRRAADALGGRAVAAAGSGYHSQRSYISRRDAYDMIEGPQHQSVASSGGMYESSSSVAVARQPWSPAQLIALVFGVIFLVIGGIALARTGIDVQHLTDRHVTVAGAGQTQLMAYIELVFGALLLGVGSVPGAGRGGMTFLGIIALVFGIVVKAQPSSFHRLGTGGGYGIFLIVAGILLVISAMVAPVYWTAKRRDGTARRSTF